ncbi:MAG TPA: TadE/TadG family type IV pilus assembly protein [Hyphomicrobium sp.]|nr:TadE/TadG family type IV pilus assembly protein [Hyphomicrobium sp.]
MRRLKRFHRDDRGSVAVIFAMMLVTMLVAAGVAIDYGRGVSLHASMQQALDAAVLAGVTEEPSQRIARAQAFFDAGIGKSEAENISVTFTKDGEDKLSGRARADIRTTLTGLLGIPTLEIATTATAEVSGGGTAVCILALSKTATQHILFNSGATVEAPECEIHGKSEASPAAIFNASTSVNTAGICLAGSQIIDNGGAHPNLNLKCATAEDPFAGELPLPVSTACTANGLNFNGGNVTLSPGVYCGWTNFNNAPNVTFNPGLYVIKGGGWNVSGGTWTGAGVTFFFADQSKIQFNSAVAANLTAPSSGTYAGLVMYEAPNLSPSQMVFNDAKDMQLKGLVYLPSRDVTFNSGSQITSKSFTLVVNTLILNQTRWKLSPSDPGIRASGGSQSARLTH